MRLTLKRFQEDAVLVLVRHIRAASSESVKGFLQSVCLTSATGSGKTVMITQAIERIVQGDGEQGAMPDATFLWITDQPELNVQTRNKMLATSSVLNSDKLVVIDPTYDQETLSPGAVHFLNTQKLGKESRLVTHGDKRTYTFWEIVRNTIDGRPGQFFVIIDEAHRGMTEDKKQADATTIIQKFIKGSPGEMTPVPIVVGISATPERFNRLILGTNRSTRPVDVDIAEVRASGLIKDSIVLYHPKREQPSDMTMLREAARTLKKFGSSWSKFCSEQDEFEVTPLLVVQVEDAPAKDKISSTDVPQAMRILRETLGTVPNDAFAHSFQEGTTVRVEPEELRYIAPSQIQEDADVRVVFFKTSLNTGWDCPRAEVMMSFRTAADATYIAQLVGRMVRAPLARAIIDNELLNTVALYLPHYDAKNLGKIVEKLTKPDDDSVPPVEIEEGSDVVDLSRAKNSEKLFEALSKVPSYVIPRTRKASQVRRLMKFARLLTNDDIDEDAVDSAYDKLVGTLNTEYNRLKKTKKFKDVVEEKAKIPMGALIWAIGTADQRAGEGPIVDIATENVNDLFDWTGRRLNEGLHKRWWRQRVKKERSASDRAKLELVALCIEPDVVAKIETAAQQCVQKWLRSHSGALRKLNEEGMSEYSEIRSLAAEPELTAIVYPTVIHTKQADARWDKHLYVDEDGKFPAKFNTAESRVLSEEINRKDVVGWLRNMDRKPWALCVNYEVSGEERPMYPDFLIIRSEKRSLVVDIIEPHTISLADAPEKAAGMAKFAAKHADKFGRIELILLDGKKEKRLDLTSESVRNKIRGVKVIDQLRSLMDEP